MRRLRSELFNFASSLAAFVNSKLRSPEQIQSIVYDNEGFLCCSTGNRRLLIVDSYKINVKKVWKEAGRTNFRNVCGTTATLKWKLKETIDGLLQRFPADLGYVVEITKTTEQEITIEQAENEWENHLQKMKGEKINA